MRVAPKTFRTRQGKMLTDADGMPIPTVAEQRRRKAEERSDRRAERAITKQLDRLLKEGKYLIEEKVEFCPGPRRGTFLLKCSVVVPKCVADAFKASAVRARKSPEDFLRVLLKANYDAVVLTRKRGLLCS